MNTLTVFLIFFGTAGTAYFIIIILIMTGILKLSKNKGSRAKEVNRNEIPPGIRVSVLVPARNEAATIGPCLEDLANQNYPGHLFEVIVIDDGSADETKDIVTGFASAHPDLDLKLVETTGQNPDQAFKKHAIRQGVETASGTLILSTDADTRRGASWIASFVEKYAETNARMIIGPVAFHQGSTLFEKIQDLEFSGLMAATAGSCAMGFPLMCNGANLAFEKQTYVDVDRDKDLRYPSGDDLFLMMRIQERWGSASITYLLSNDAVVLTRPKESLKSFFHQRLRWVSKSGGYPNPVVLLVSVVTWIFNTLLLAGAAFSLLDTGILAWCGIGFGVKLLLEFPAVSFYLRFTGKRNLWWWFPLAQLLNVVYVALIGILGNVLPYEWKGRKVSPLKKGPA